MRARGRAGARDAVLARTCRTDSSAPLGQPSWQGARGAMADDPCCCAGLPGPLTGRGRGIASVKSVARSRSRSQRVAIQTLPLLRGWQPRCARYAQSQGSCTRGRARGGRRARLNLMRPCRLGPKSAEPNTYSEPPKSAFCRSSPQPTYRRPQWARIPISVRKSLLGTLNTGEFLPELRGTSRCSLRQGLAQNHARGAPLTQSKTSTQKRMCTIPTAGKDQSQSSV